MSESAIAVFDSDGHVDENLDEIAACFEGAYARPKWTQIHGIFPSPDGWSRGVIIDRGDKEREHRRTDAAIWSDVLARLGTEGSVLYPTSGLTLGLMRDGDYAAATATAYNNWLEKHYTSRDRRLYGAGLMTVQKPPAAVAEIKRCVAEWTNFCAMILPAVTAEARSYGDEYYWPIYQEAERHESPLEHIAGELSGFLADAAYDGETKINILHRNCKELYRLP